MPQIARDSDYENHFKPKISKIFFVFSFLVKYGFAYGDYDLK